MIFDFLYEQLLTLILVLKSELEFWTKLSVHTHASSAHERVPPLVHELGVGADQVLHPLALVLLAAARVDQQLCHRVIKQLGLLPPDVELVEVLDVGTVGHLGEQLLPHLQMFLLVPGLRQVDEGHLSWSLEEVVEIKLLIICFTEGD